MPRSASVARIGMLPPLRTSTGSVPVARWMAARASLSAGSDGSNIAGRPRP